MKKRNLFLMVSVLVAVLLAGGLFGSVANAGIGNNITIVNQQNFRAVTSVHTGTSVSALSAQIQNTNTGTRSPVEIRTGNNLMGSATSQTVHLQLGHWAQGTHQHRLQGALSWSSLTFTSQMRSR